MIGGGTQQTWASCQKAAMEEGLAHLRRMSRLPFLWLHAQRVQQGATPSVAVYEEDKVRLLHYTPDVERRYATPLLFVFALVNRPYILDLKPGKSVVEHFVRRGFDTYLLDWGVPTYADRHLTLEDYIDGYLRNVVDRIRERSGSPRVNILGYCMGGTMSSMFTALYPERVKNLILMAAGIDFEPSDGLLNVWTDPQYFDVDAFVDAFGNCPAEFLQGSFLLLKPVQNLLEKPINFYERLDDDAFVDDYFAMEGWLNDNIPVAGETFRQFVKLLYQRNLLIKGQFPLGWRAVHLGDITCPVLNLMAEKDDLVPCGQSRPFNDLIGSKDRKSIVFPAGHIGLAVGSRAQRELWPTVCDWLAVRSEPAGANGAPVARSSGSSSGEKQMKGSS
jgi:polyhydroxyalkanoate synthase